MKAMILAAGRGERMRPLTLTTPKPLLPIGNTTLIDHTITEIKKAGITDIIINVHHLGDQIIQHCGNGDTRGIRIQYSIEERLLDTGGGIYQALSKLGDAPFLVLSADIWTDFPLSTLTQKKTDGAHLVLVDNPAFHQQGDFGLDHNHKINLTAPEKLTYANIGVFHPALFQFMHGCAFPLRDALHPAIQNNKVSGEHYHGQWYNVGTPAELDKVRNKIV